MPLWVDFGLIVLGSLAVAGGALWSYSVDAFYDMEQQEDRNEFEIALVALPGVEAYYIPPDRVPVIHQVYVSGVRLYASQVEVQSLRGMYNYRSRPGFYSVQDRFVHLFPIPDASYPVLVRGAPSTTWFYGYYPENDAARKNQEERIETSITLMLDWLSPKQRKSLLEKKYFEVKGNVSHRLYRIQPAMTFNVHELDHEGKPAAKMCFVPDNAPYLGDIMLAQKLTLETNELEAVRVANRQQQFYEHDFNSGLHADFNELIARCWEKKKKRKPKVDKPSTLP